MAFLHLRLRRSSLRNCKASTATIVTIGLLLAPVTVSSGEDQLTPKAVKDSAQKGFDHADREVEKQQLQKAKSEGMLTEEGIERFKSIEALNEDYETWRAAATRKVSDVAERARRARSLQHRLEKLKTSTDFSAPRERAQVRGELEYIMRGTPELPELPPLVSYLISRP